jgi:hypothetical protein
MSHIHNHTKHDSKYKNFTIFPSILGEIDAAKTRFQLAKCRKWPIFNDVGFQNFDIIYEEQLVAHIQNHTKHDFDT